MALVGSDGRPCGLEVDPDTRNGEARRAVHVDGLELQFSSMPKMRPQLVCAMGSKASSQATAGGS
jgi:hypothetical protein